MSAPPVDPRDFPDPFILNDGGTYVAYATNAGNTNVQVMTSEDLKTWRAQPDALPTLPAWAVRGFTWAPTVLPRAAGYALYYTVREPRGGRQAISVGYSTSPLGAFVDTSTGPLVYQQELGGSIDASPFVDIDGTAYLVWKADANAIHQPSSLWIQPLAPDGLTLTQSPSQLLGYDAAWENPLIEAPSVVSGGGQYFLFYSANWWNTARYGIGFAVADHVLGPYTKMTTAGPWFASDDMVAGPGGQEWFTDRDGSLRMAYHGWDPAHVGYPGGARSLRLATVSLDGATPSVS